MGRKKPGAEVLWFTSRTNGTLFHARVNETGTAQCSVNIKPSTTSGLATMEELGRNEGAVICLRCKAKLAVPITEPTPEDTTPVRVATPARRLTASQTWERLTPLQREALLGWFAGSYAPSRNAARFPLCKTPILTHAEKIIAENWKGLEP